MQPLILVMCLTQVLGAPTDSEPVSKTIAQVLREPLPSEDISCTVTDTSVVVTGPVFRYTVDRASGAVSGLEATRDGKTVVFLREPASLWLDTANLARVTDGNTQILEDGPARVVLETKCQWIPELPCVLRTTIYNDGVLVSEITLTPGTDVVLRQGLRHEISASGRFTHYLHKRQDTNGLDCFQGALPAPGETARMNTPTSCLEAFSDEAALALFTDMRRFYPSMVALDSATLHRLPDNGDSINLALCQYLIHTGPEDAPITLHAGEAISFRIGLAVAPNRLPHPRRRDLRMFIWVGDEKSPYPSDEEILAAARLGYTLFQMHRLGPPGEPRPPAAELDRVLKTVHDAGMLFIWTANADLQYRHDPVVEKMVADGQWPRWQGFNYGGQYKATMDSFCDTLATCLASPNGLADYRIECDQRMLERYPVDGMYIDDNLAYENCTLCKEHGHPQQVYDCLIELHEMNWRRRQAIKEGCPHAVLIDHSSHAFVLPIIAPFDSHLFGEGYTFPSVEMFRDTFGSYQNMYAQGCLWAGDSETTRCAVQTAYAFDLLTGGGQYSYLDWRLWPDKFPYASGVDANEPLFVRTYNLAQYYFGLYESVFEDGLTTTASGTYAAQYHNRVWNDVLVVMANMTDADTACSLAVPTEPAARLQSDRPILYYDIHHRTIFRNPEQPGQPPFEAVPLRPYQTRLFYLRPVPETMPFHVWGGKRLAETWAADTGEYSLLLAGPEGLEDWIVLNTGDTSPGTVRVNDTNAPFFQDAKQGLLYGQVTFGRQPVLITTRRSISSTPSDDTGVFPEKPLPSDDLTTYYLDHS